MMKEKNERYIKVLLGITFVVVIFAVIYCVVGLVNPVKNVIEEQKEQQQEEIRAEKADPIVNQYENGFIYEYSDEEINEFKKLIEAQLEEEKISINVKPGQMRDSAGMASISSGTPEENDEYAYNNIFNTFGDYVDYNPKDLKPGDMFNENLSLSKPDLFYGYASVGKNDIDLEKLHIDYATEYLNDGNFYYFSNFLNGAGNSNEIDGTNLYEKINKFLLSNNDILKSKYLIGGSKLIYEKWENLDNKNYLNVLHNFLRIRPYTDGRVLNLYNKKLQKIETYPEKYNYFAENTDPYFFYFYPKRVEKVNSKTYAVDIETTAPFTQRAMLMIVTQIMNNFYTENNNYVKYQRNTTLEEYNKKCNEAMLEKEIRITDEIDFDIIIRINKEDINNNLLIEGTEVSVFYPRVLLENVDDALNLENYIYDDYTNNSSKHLQTTQFEIPWYPNQKAQEILTNYFDKISNIINDNKNKTFDEIMLEVSDEEEVSLNDVKSIVYSYYYKYVHME